ncbi:unnamed protein product, partial [Iphiclides podalirius]
MELFLEKVYLIQTFSARVLEQTCSALAGKRVAALLVCGGGPSAAAVVTAATRAGVPVLRTSPSHLHLSYTIANDMLPLEIRLEITARETLHALRATLLHTHWHTFTLLAEEDVYSSLFLRKDLSKILTTPPLNPKWLSLPTKYSKHAIFRRLAEVSRLTRGVVVLICDIHYAKVVMDEAKRLNMLDGHFFWLWLDASSEFDVFRNIANSTQYTEDNDNDFASFRDKEEALLYDGFDRTKENKSIIFNDLPIGLLALYPQPMVIDRTFIRSAVQITVGSLRRVLRACDAWSAQAQFLSDATASCWEEPSDAAADFSLEFVR